MTAYWRLRHIIDFAFHNFGLFGTRWWHGLATFALLVGCFCSTAYIIGEYYGQSDAYVMVGSSAENELATFTCAASEYCRFTPLRAPASRSVELRSGGNLTLQTNASVWLIEVLTRSEFRARRGAFALSAGNGTLPFPPVEQMILMKFTLSLTRDYRSSGPAALDWTIKNWEEYDEYYECANASRGFDEVVSYTCGAYEVHFSAETYAKRYRIDIQLANTAFFILGSWVVNAASVWVLVHGFDLVLRINKDLGKLDKGQ